MLGIAKLLPCMVSVNREIPQVVSPIMTAQMRGVVPVKSLFSTRTMDYRLFLHFWDGVPPVAALQGES